MTRRAWLAALALIAAVCTAPAAGASGGASQYLVVFKPGHSGQASGRWSAPADTSSASTASASAP